MAKEKRYKCIKGWARNKIGDVVEAYEFFRYPEDIRRGRFVEIEDEVAPTKKEKPVFSKPEKKVEQPIND